MGAMKVYRIHIRPKGGKNDPVISFAYCLKEKVLGLGWRVPNLVSGVSWEAYEKAAVSQFGDLSKLSRVRYLKNRLKEDDLLWTRDENGNYYLARVLSGWEYYTSNEARDADITNVVRCDLFRVPSVDEVPGKVVASFRPNRTIQAIDNETVRDYSSYLFNKLSNTGHYTINLGEFGNIFSFLDSEQTEDVIFIYLQTENWMVIPNSRKPDMMKYEFYLIHRETKERAIVQVKTGYTHLNIADWKGRTEKVFLFQSNGIYRGSQEDRIECLEPDQIKKFIYSNLELMPQNIAHWANLAKEKGQI